jgi:hypothetical protein
VAVEGQRLALEFRTMTSDINQKARLAVADYWQRVGVAVDKVVIPSLRLDGSALPRHVPGVRRRGGGSRGTNSTGT